VKFSGRRKPFDLLDLTPLIDVVFLLLIFFMVSTTFIHEPGGIKVDLPHSDTQEFIRESGEVVIEITEEGGLYVDEVPVDEEALRAALRRTMRADPESVVIIKADRGVEHGRVVQVMDWSKRAGLYRLAVATEGSRLTRPLRDTGAGR